MHFNVIGVVGVCDNNKISDTVNALITLLLAQQNKITLIVEDKLQPLINVSGVQLMSRAQLGNVCDLIIVVGGDGSLIGAARDFAHHQVAVLGINRGYLGFLTDIAADDLSIQIMQVLAGNYQEEQRFLLQASTLRNNNHLASSCALNDVVLHPGEATKMLEFEIYINDKFVSSQKSDGLIVSTPTGSTAYALSAGGPILYPELDAILLVPMYPHTLSNRPIVVAGSSRIKIIISKSVAVRPMISCDGQNHIECAAGDILTISKAPHYLRLIHPHQHDFYEACRTKLGWANRLGGKYDN